MAMSLINFSKSWHSCLIFKKYQLNKYRFTKKKRQGGRKEGREERRKQGREERREKGNKQMSAINNKRAFSFT